MNIIRVSSIREQAHPLPHKAQRNGQQHSSGAMEEMSQKVQNASSHPKILRTHKVTVKFSGAMEDMSGKVQNASTHPLGHKNHEHVHSSRSVQGPVQGGDG